MVVEQERTPYGRIVEGVAVVVIATLLCWMSFTLYQADKSLDLVKYQVNRLAADDTAGKISSLDKRLDRIEYQLNQSERGNHE